MKYASLVLSALALVLAVYLLATRNSESPRVEAPTETTDDGAEASSKVVFVYADTVLTQYKEFADKQAALEKRQIDAETSLQKKATSLQREIQGVQAKMQQGLLSQNQIAAEQERIGRKEQSILQEREQVGQQLMLEGQTLNDSLQAKIKRTLTTMRDDFGYDYILSYGPGTGVIMVNDAYDVSAELLRRLNALEPDEN